MQAYSIKRIIIPLITALILPAVYCTAPVQKPGNELRFVVMGNTSPASPYTGHPEKLEQVFRAINQENPLMVVHTGNVIQGGDERTGIMNDDITRQFRKFFEQKKSLSPLMHILAGDRDRYNGSLDLFREFTGGNLYYSFNYGNDHFIILNILAGERRIGKDQMEWLKRDLETHRYDAAIFVFTHYPVLNSPQSGIRCEGGEELHKLFVRYPVKAVISGYLKNLYEHEKDGIRYIAAGCFGFNNEDWHWNYNQFYVAHFDGIKLSIRGVRVNFPGPVYRH